MLLLRSSDNEKVQECICACHAWKRKGLLRELNPGPLAPEARIIPLDQAANETESLSKKANYNSAELVTLRTGAETAKREQAHNELCPLGLMDKASDF